MLYFDSHFSMGRTHLTCEDYARRGHSPFPWVMVSDGCSSSNDTDIGARLLVLSAQRCFSQLHNLPDYHTFGQQVIMQAVKISQPLDLPDNALDATLSIAIVKGRIVHIYIYGDGFILLKNNENSWRVIDIFFSQNAPYYLSYWIDESYRVSYQKILTSLNALHVKDGTHSDLFSYDKALQYQFSLDDYPLIAIASDGLSKFINMNDYKPISIETLLPQLFDFPSLSGSFVKRRLPAVLSGLESQKILPFDDLSLGVFVDTIS
jgi:hypothetical protein